MTEGNGPVRFGYSEADITPDRPVELVGFHRISNTSKGVLHRLRSQVLVCGTETEKCCLLTIDSIGFTVAITDHLRDLVAGEIGCARERVMVCFSHTHSAPDVGVEEEYRSFLCDRVVGAVKEAKENMVPLNAAWGVARSDIGINRRGGKSITDSRLGVLELADEANEIRLLLLRVTAHANVLSSDNYRISPDYFGTTRDLLEEKYGCRVMMVQGASGDIRPKYQQENAEYLEIHAFEASSTPYSEQEARRYFEQSMAALERMADSIRRSVDEVLEELQPAPVRFLTMFSEKKTFFADVPDGERALQIVEEARREAGIAGASWLREVERLQGENVRAQKADIELQYFMLDDGCLCGSPNEAMCEIALDIQERAGTPLLFFGGYVNGIDSYLPTAREYDRGGYEVLWSNLIYHRYHGRVMPLNRNTAADIAEIVADTWKRVAAGSASR